MTRGSIASDLPASEVPNTILQAALRSGFVHDEAGRAVELSSNIAPHLAEALYRAVLAARPSLVVEIGMAHGISTLAILTALDQIGRDGSLVSIDPNQTKDWRRAGVAGVRRAGFESRHRLIEQEDCMALPGLLSEGLKIDFAYIDGWHTFDHVLLDFFYLDRMLRPGGVIGFNDCGMRSVHRVLRFVRTHRCYRAIDVGLKRDYRSRYPGSSIIKRFVGRSTEDQYFMKLSEWEPDWSFYARF